MARVGVLLAAVVAAAVAAAAGFYTTSDRSGPGPAACGGTRNNPSQCIPGIAGEAVVDVLEERGFRCDQGRFCEFGAGGTSYRADVNANEAVDFLIVSYALDVRYEPALELGPSALGFLTWFVTLPFGDDPEADAVSREWLAENVGSDEQVTIRGFEYTLQAPEAGHVRLVYDGVFDPGPPRTIDGEEVPMPTVRQPEPPAPQADAEPDDG